MRRAEPEPIESASLPTGAPCLRCNGERHGSNVNGGWLPTVKLQGGTWYSYAHCCPDCAWGAYRAHCTRQPMYRQLPDADVRELGMLHGVLTTGHSLRTAVESLPGPVRMKLLPNVDAIEAREQGWGQYQQSQLTTGNSGF